MHAKKKNRVEGRDEGKKKDRYKKENQKAIMYGVKAREEEEEMNENQEELRENLGRKHDMKDPSKKKMASLLP